MTTRKGTEYGKGTTPNPAVSKYAALSEGAASGDISWADVSGPLIKQALAAATDDGCALIFSKTSDGGALSLTVLAGKERSKLYAKTTDIAESLLHELIALSGS